MVAFRKMTSKTTRSTLTFALFATILTLNIFIATWSYSFRWGFDSVVVELSSGSDILLYSPEPIPDATNFSTQVAEDFDLKFVRGFTRSYEPIETNLELDDPDSVHSATMVTMRKGSLGDPDSVYDLKFNLVDNKSGAVTADGDPLETYENQDEDQAFTDEDQFVWEALFNNITLLNNDNVPKPMILTTFIFEIDGFNFEQTKFPGDSVYINLTDGSTQEFVIGSVVDSNPVNDFVVEMEEGPPTFASTWYVNDYWASQIEGLAELQGHSNLFLGKSTIDDITSERVEELVTRIEVWANGKDSEFRAENELYGVIGVTVYSIYEAFLEGQYRFFLFLQAFVSLGFVVGILGLLVVASRSVAERKREIGMLRALGFRRMDVVISVVLELVVMGLIGLFIGFVNGTILGYALTDINSGGEATFLMPWALIAFYGFLTLFSAIIAAIVPAIQASRIPPSDALRYTG
jgi:hypothetical protein